MKHSPRKGGWRRPFHIARPSCNPRPSCSAAVLGGIWRRGPGKTPHTSSPGHSAPWTSAAPLSCGSQTQTVVACTQTPHWSGETQKWTVACRVCCPEMDCAGRESHLCSSVSLLKPLWVFNSHSVYFRSEQSPQVIPLKAVRWIPAVSTCPQFSSK